jgi:nitric oxide reductase large subunit
MSHEAPHSTNQQQPSTSFNSAIWFVVVLAILFICAVNFVSVMGNDHEQKEAKTEATQTHEGGGEH